MASRYEDVKAELKKAPRSWLVTGAAGFIGSHLVETLLELNQTVVGLDNFCTGHWKNIADIQAKVGAGKAGRFKMITGDIRNLDDCRKACEGADVILHQAALGSVPRSIKDPLATHTTNVDGFFNMILAAKDAGIQSFVYASSSSVYGDDPNLPKTEERIGKPLSPYALSKRINEEIAEIFARAYGFRSIGLRYFNVFGPRQDPEGPYAAVIPKWFSALAKSGSPAIYGDGETSRDFCFVANAVQANILAAMARDEEVWNQVYNVACGDRTTLNNLFRMIRSEVAKRVPSALSVEADYEPFREGDIRHSLANIGKAESLFGFSPTYFVAEGLAESAFWFLQKQICEETLVFKAQGGKQHEAK
jgi:UDP-N-acetylglucosamine 4-epimerase